MSPIPEKMSLKDSVYQQIVEMICSGQLTTEMIFTESQMIDRFRVSKSPVREALIQLCHEEVLKSLPRCGYQVVQVSAKSIRDLTELRFYLELSSLSKVMDNLTEERIGHLKQVNAQRLQPFPVKNIWSAWSNNVRFHLSLVELAGNVQVTKAMERALATCTRAYAQLFTVQSAVIAPSNENYHDKIIYALEGHKLHTAYELLKTDILFMEDQLLSTNIAK